MNAHVQKWGNSLALRIPKSYARDVHISDGSVVDISVRSGKILVDPVKPGRYSLDELLRGINRKNLHHEVDTGLPVGKEFA
jgi:antitoxin MazE